MTKTKRSGEWEWRFVLSSVKSPILSAMYPLLNTGSNLVWRKTPWQHHGEYIQTSKTWWPLQVHWHFSSVVTHFQVNRLSSSVVTHFQVNRLSSSVVTSQCTNFPVQKSLLSVLTFQFSGHFSVYHLSNSVVTSQCTNFPVQQSLRVYQFSSSVVIFQCANFPVHQSLPSVPIFQFSGHFQVTRTKMPCHAWDHGLVNHATGQSSTPGCTHCHQTLNVTLSTLHIQIHSATPGSLVTYLSHACMPSYLRVTLLCLVTCMPSYLRVTLLCLVTS